MAGIQALFIPMKPIRNGFKIYVMSSSQGYILKFIPSSFLFKEKTTVEEIVFSLTQGYKGKGYHLFMDKFFTTIQLFRKLQLKNFAASGTFSNNHLPSSIPVLGKTKVENMHFWKGTARDSNLMLCCWESKKVCYFVSNAISNQITLNYEQIRPKNIKKF